MKTNLSHSLAVLLFSILLASGCGTTDYKVKPGKIDANNVSQYRIVGPIEVQGMRQDRYIVLHPIAMLQVNYREVAESAASMLYEELESRIETVDAGSTRSLQIHISDMRLIGGFECYINFVVETGDGYQRGYQAYGKNWNYQNVCNEALPDIGKNVIGDPNIQAYLQNQVPPQPGIPEIK